MRKILPVLLLAALCALPAMAQTTETVTNVPLTLTLPTGNCTNLTLVQTSTPATRYVVNDYAFSPTAWTFPMSPGQTYTFVPPAGTGAPIGAVLGTVVAPSRGPFTFSLTCNTNVPPSPSQPSLQAGAGISISGTWPNQKVTNTSGGSGTVTSVGLLGTANQITVTGTSPITSSGSWTLSIPSSPTLPGTTTGTFSGPLTGNVTGNVSGSSGSTTGNAATATALAASPTNCSAGQAPRGINASGTAQNCTAYAPAFTVYHASATGISDEVGIPATTLVTTSNTGMWQICIYLTYASGIVSQVQGAVDYTDTVGAVGPQPVGDNLAATSAPYVNFGNTAGTGTTDCASFYSASGAAIKYEVDAMGLSAGTFNAYVTLQEIAVF
jgi:hypothetical protein